MKSVTSKRMKQIDKLASRRYKIPSLILMENAGLRAAGEAMRLLKGRSGRVIIFCGYGNNGGDGLVAARHLLNNNIKLRIYFVGKKRPFSEETQTNFDILKAMGEKAFRISTIRDIIKLGRNINNAGLIIDGIFGIGLKGELNPFYRMLFNAINNSAPPVLALDVPSGLSADRGIPLGEAIKAKATVTFGCPKKGFSKKSARPYIGRLIVADISLPRKLVCR